MREREFASFPMELAQVSAKGRTLAGYASAFDVAIDSGRNQKTYVRHGAFTKTIKENRGDIQVLVNHGMDPRWGMSPVAVPTKIGPEDKYGLPVEAEIIDDPSFDPLVASLKAGAFRAMSIQFETMQESYNDDRTERNLEQVRLHEFGPVTFPANTGAVATLHSLAQFAVALDKLEDHWDGPAALRTCKSAADFRQIAFERNNDSDPDTAAHWTLPHHPRPGAGPDSAGVAAALAALGGARGGAPDLKQSVVTVRGHLERHQAESSSDGGRVTEEADAPLKMTVSPEWLEKTRLAHEEERTLQWEA